MSKVSLRYMPAPNREYTLNLENFVGGLNLRELDYRINNAESPEMKNLWWRDGVLCSRPAQVAVGTELAGTTIVAAYNRLWHGDAFIHVVGSSGGTIWRVNMSSGGRVSVYAADRMTTPGTFFTYGENLYYKTKGFYVKMSYSAGAANPVSAVNVSGYIPVTYINCDPGSGAGDIYQPENRLSAKSELWYNASTTSTYATGYTTLEGIDSRSYFTPDVDEPIFIDAVSNTLGTYSFAYSRSTGWRMNQTTVCSVVSLTSVSVPNVHKFYEFALSTLMDEPPFPPVTDPYGTYTFTCASDYSWDYTGTNGSQGIIDSVAGLSVIGVNITGTPQVGSSFAVTLAISSEPIYLETYGIQLENDMLYDTGEVWVTLDYTDTYYLPVSVDSIVSATVNGIAATYTYDPTAGAHGAVIFSTPPKGYNPPVNNTVHIVYKKTNTTAYNNIMDCTMATTYGGTGALCIVMAGSSTQPNAYFWNGQTDISVDPAYFPMTQYQLAGDSHDPITGFGKQQGYLIIFKEHSVGRTSFATETVDERLTIDLAYVGINDKMGCDLPNTIQLVENNLVWCNKAEGVLFLANTSSAYENNIIQISHKVNDSHESWTSGLLYEIGRYAAFAYDDDRHYWIVVNGHVWMWDYYISDYKNPSWFYFDNIVSKGFVQSGNTLWCFNTTSKVHKFTNDVYSESVSGTSAPISRVFRFAAQYFGTFDVKKNVNSVTIALGTKTNIHVALKYMTDLETRDDLTPLVYEAPQSDPKLIHNNFAGIFRRRPMCRRVQFFTMKLTDNTAEEFALISAQIYYTHQGRQR